MSTKYSPFKRTEMWHYLSYSMSVVHSTTRTSIFPQWEYKINDKNAVLNYMRATQNFR